MSSSPTTIEQALSHATKQLRAAGIATARLDALVLLEDLLNTNRTQILAHPERGITEVELEKLRVSITQRSHHIPLAYIRGKTEFYGREFIITQDVLEPRPESETMIDLLKQLPGPVDSVIDIGTGSGALAITAKLELLSPAICAIDIDPKCLQVAKNNAKRLQADVTFLSGDLLAPVPVTALNTQTVLLCNLPYVPDTFQVNTAALHEPRLAIFGGPDGLELYRKLFRQIIGMSHRPTYVLTESMPPQHKALTDIAIDTGYTLTTSEDFIQVFRHPLAD